MEKILHVRTDLGDIEGVAKVVDEALRIIIPQCSNRTAGMWITPWLAEPCVLEGRAPAAELAAAVIAESGTPT